MLPIQVQLHVRSEIKSIKKNLSIAIYHEFGAQICVWNVKIASEGLALDPDGGKAP